MKKIFVILLAISLFIMCSVMGGCSDNSSAPVENVSPNTPVDSVDVVSSTAAVNEPVEDAPPADENENEYSDDECLLKNLLVYERDDSRYSKVYEADFGGEYIEQYYLWCDSEMTDVKCVCITTNFDSDDAIRYEQSGVILAVDSVKPGEAVFMSLEVPDVLPPAAVICNIDGKHYIWLVMYNGRDGGISLVPCTEDEFIY